jgi:hypothetical protein
MARVKNYGIQCQWFTLRLLWTTRERRAARQGRGGQCRGRLKKFSSAGHE